MALNKTKVLDNAQRYLNSGKVTEAIGEYQQILRAEPRDQASLMTVGDLYVRVGDTQRALEHYEKLADLLQHDGFTNKAIAVYKKIAKLAPAETAPLEKLADLYAQQGIMSEARPLFLQLAETHLKQRRPQRAVEMLRKLLEVEPGNARVQTRLAELYQAIGQPKEAAAAYMSMAQQALDRSATKEALEMADHALAIDPATPGASGLKARAVAASGDPEKAIAALEALTGPDATRETTYLLLDLYLKAGKSARAAGLALTAFQRGSSYYPKVLEVATLLADGSDPDAALGLLRDTREGLTEAGEQEPLSQAISRVAERIPGRIEPLEWLVELYNRTGDNFRRDSAQERLAEALAQSGDFSRAESILRELHERSPENIALRQQLNQVLAKQGQSPLPQRDQEPPKPPEVESLPLPTPPPAPPVAEPELDEATKQMVQQTMTDVDLFSSYGLAQKAISLLEKSLAQVPLHAGMLEKLLDLYIGSSDQRRTAELAARLEQLYLERGDAAGAERCGDLRRRFQRSSGLSAEELEASLATVQAAEFVLPVPAQPAELETPKRELQEVQEVDLSDEWEQLAQIVDEPPPAAPEVVPANASAAAPAEEEVPEFELELAADDPELDQIRHLVSAGTPPATPPAGDFLSELAAEVGEMEPPSPHAEPAVVESAQVLQADRADSGRLDQLHEVFEEFRSELGELGAEDEDLETHYNLGVAYREMGLLDEAIGEFQKVAKSVESGRQFRYGMQCRTLLGLTFMQKGEPKIAAVWYEKALHAPGLDPESVVALRYDLGVAQEQAGDHSAALESFQQVYASNIDYRDVAEHIAVLTKN